MQEPGAHQPSGYSPKPQVRFDAIGEAWQLLLQQIGVWIPVMLIYVVVSSIFGAIQYGTIISTGAIPGGFPPAGSVPTPDNPFGTPGIPTPTYSPLQLVLQFVQFLITVFFMGGLYRMATKQVRGEVINVGDLFSVTDVYPSLLGAMLLTSLAMAVGFCLCLIPGLIVAGLTMFTLPLIVDKRLGAIEAIGQSWSTLKKQTLMATLFHLVAALIGIAGACACFVGYFFTWPLYILSVAVLYRDFFMGQITPPAPSTPTPYPPPPIPEPGPENRP